MKVAVISKAGPTGGGASRVAHNLARELRGAGHDVTHWQAHKHEDGPPPTRRIYGNRLPSRLAMWFGHHSQGAIGVPELLPIELLNRKFVNSLLAADVIHVHDITDAVSVDTLAWVAERKPLAWTLHDTSPFTGGCINPLGCTRYQQTCGRCPQHGQWPLYGALDGSRILRWRKRKFAEATQFQPVAPSKWMADMAEGSGNFRRPLVISNSVDLRVFKGGDKRTAREELRVPADRPVVAVGAGHLADPRKGLRQVASALSSIAGRNPLVLAIGDDDKPGVREALPGVDIRFTGYLRDRTRLAAVFRSADVFLYASLADNQPLVVMEAMACGTPVIGYATGGIPEMVYNHEHGLLVPTGDTEKLADALNTALASPETLRDWGDRAEARAKAEYSDDLFLQRHLELYRGLAR